MDWLKKKGNLTHLNSFFCQQMLVEALSVGSCWSNLEDCYLIDVSPLSQSLSSVWVSVTCSFHSLASGPYIALAVLVSRQSRYKPWAVMRTTVCHVGIVLLCSLELTFYFSNRPHLNLLQIIFFYCKHSLMKFNSACMFVLEFYFLLNL